MGSMSFYFGVIPPLPTQPRFTFYGLPVDLDRDARYQPDRSVEARQVSG
jgi:hypothetical protein